MTDGSPPGLHRAIVLTIILSLLSPLAAGGGAADYLKKSDEWFASPDGRRIAANIVSYQSDSGGWPKNTDTVDAPYTGARKKLKPTFDNGATTGELRFLARCINVANGESDRAAFTKGLAYILKAQYPTGGWPQFDPPGKQYHRHITFNDGAMVRLLEFLRDVQRSDIYQFVPSADRKAAGEAFEKGIACILKCQIRVDGKPTVWCAQHDELDYSPRPARAFEPASFSGSESVGITRLLMSLDSPGPEVVAAVEGAVAWLESAKLKGIRLEKGIDLTVVSDPAAPPLWARFYDLKSGKPFFCDRDGVPKSTLAEIGTERRNGYAWYGVWPRALLEKDYPAWRKRVK
ncbi:MAG: pectate lyase [Verrucomicrobiota bacterium]